MLHFLQRWPQFNIIPMLWRNLSKNRALPWTPELIEAHRDKWDWSLLSQNKGVYHKVFESYLDDTIVDSIIGSDYVFD